MHLIVISLKYVVFAEDEAWQIVCEPSLLTRAAHRPPYQLGEFQQALAQPSLLSAIFTGAPQVRRRHAGRLVRLELLHALAGDSDTTGPSSDAPRLLEWAVR